MVKKIRRKIVSDAEKKAKEASNSDSDVPVSTNSADLIKDKVLSSGSKQKSATTNVVSLISLCVSVLVLISGSWLVFQSWTELKSHSVHLELLDDLTDQSNKAIDNLSSQTKRSEIGQTEILRELDERFQSLQLQVTAQGARLAELGSTSRSDWYLSEAAYLTRLASQRLQTERSTTNPLALLLQADSILLNLNEEELFSVRKAIADDVVSLRLAGPVDVEGIILELNAISKQIDHLKLMQVSPSRSEVHLGDKAMSANGADQLGMADSSLESLADQFRRQLLGLIKVRERKKTIEPVLTYSEESILRNNLKLFLNQAANAVLREEKIIFELSLDNALDLISVHFSDAPPSVLIKDRISHLRHLKVTQTLPDISGSIAALEHFIIVRQSRLIKVDPPEILEEP
jgi:uroporphyrin-3 C-methyltransferase